MRKQNLIFLFVSIATFIAASTLVKALIHDDDAIYVVPCELLQEASVYPKDEIDALVLAGDKGGTVGRARLSPGGGAYIQAHYTKTASNISPQYYVRVTSKYSIEPFLVKNQNLLLLLFSVLFLVMLGFTIHANETKKSDKSASGRKS